MHFIDVIDSHTGGEPTRLVMSGGPDLGTGSMAVRLQRFCTGHDRFRSAIVNEPRGSDAMVGALLCEPESPDAAAGVIFFNHVGYLGMCGHGTIGLVTSLAWAGRIHPGDHLIETPVGPVSAVLLASGEVTITNVPSYRYAVNVQVDVASHGTITGDIAWGGNWFFLIEESPLALELSNLEQLISFTSRIREALSRKGITGGDGREIDHIELSGPPHHLSAHSRNFVLCPGKAYDRSPCGTGTSAKLACLFADGKIQPGEIWRQESIVGSIFESSIQLRGSEVHPRITGTAFVNGEGRLVLDPRDPFCWGICPNETDRTP